MAKFRSVAFSFLFTSGWLMGSHHIYLGTKQQYITMIANGAGILAIIFAVYVAAPIEHTWDCNTNQGAPLAAMHVCTPTAPAGLWFGVLLGTGLALIVSNLVKVFTYDLKHITRWADAGSADLLKSMQKLPFSSEHDRTLAYHFLMSGGDINQTLVLLAAAQAKAIHQQHHGGH